MLLSLAVAAASAAPVSVGPGLHRPFYPPAEGPDAVRIAAFRMDATPVTVGAYRSFVLEHPEWQRGAPPAVFADEGYLAAWAGPADPGDLAAELPVTGVSWFAARAYCRAAGGDLPTVYQWEFAADATAEAPSGGREDPETLARILAWYGEGPGASLHPVGRGTPNYWGLYDMHGLVWEWTLDFNSQLISADARDAGQEQNLRFCGAGALSARDVEDYASFMRFAMRSALGARYTTEALGFRCAYTP